MDRSNGDSLNWFSDETVEQPHDSVFLAELWLTQPFGTFTKLDQTAFLRALHGLADDLNRGQYHDVKIFHLEKPNA